MSRKTVVTIRFGVGSPPDRCSGVWQLFVSDPERNPRATSDMYVQPLALKRVFKTSLHESGSWQTGLIEGARDRYTDIPELPTGSRHMFVWSRPMPQFPGLTVAYRILVPVSELTPLGQPETWPMDIAWHPPPEGDSAVEYSILLAAPGVNKLELEPNHQDRVGCLFQQRLPNGETVHLVHRVVQTDAALWSNIHQAADQMAKALGPVETSPYLRTMLHVQQPDGAWAIIDTAWPVRHPALSERKAET
jgi:hypothetical protein